MAGLTDTKFNDQKLQKLFYEMSYNLPLISAINIFQLSKGVNDNDSCFFSLLGNRAVEKGKFYFHHHQ